MKLTSPAFNEGEKIPSKYTCEGENVNPPLDFAEIPPTAKSLVLIMDDPDVPASVRKDRMWVHWIVFNMPPSTKKLSENKTPPGLQGKNTGGENAYQGPCPPDREHRYFFKLYALSTLLNLPEGATKEDLKKAMKGHILAEARLIGVYNLMKK